MSRVRVLVIDGQGGGLGRQLTAALAAGCPDIELTAVGTNSIAASAMLKAGAHRAAKRGRTVKGNDVYGVRPERVTIFIVKKYGVIYRLQGLS